MRPKVQAVIESARPARYGSGMPIRVYADTSVYGGVFDPVIAAVIAYEN